MVTGIAVPHADVGSLRNEVSSAMPDDAGHSDPTGRAGDDVDIGSRGHR